MAVLNICWRTIEDFNEVYEHELEYSYEMVRMRLLGILNNGRGAESHMFLFIRGKEHTDDRIFEAPPLLLAVCMGLYDIARNLMECGCSTVRLDEEGNMVDLRGICKIGDQEGYISLGQYIMGDPNMPDEFRLYLWRKIAKEKKEHDNIYCQKCGKVIDFSYICFDCNDICAKLFSDAESISMTMSTVFETTVLKTISMISEKAPDYLRIVFCDNWFNLISNNCSGVSYEIAKIMLEKVLTTDSQRINMIELLSEKAKYSDWKSDEFRPDIGFGRRWIVCYANIAKYYVRNSVLWTTFLNCMVKDYLKIYRYYRRFPFALSGEEVCMEEMRYFFLMYNFFLTRKLY